MPSIMSITCTILSHPSHAVVGEKEQANKTVNVRTRDNQVHGEHPVEDLVLTLHRLNKSRVLDDTKEFSKE